MGPGARPGRAGGGQRKKVLASELAAHFPTRFSGADSEALLHYQQQQKRLLALCDFVGTAQARHLAIVAEIDNWLLDQNPPDIFDEGASGNVLTQGRQRFGSLCAALAEQGYPRPHELSLFDFHAAVAYLTEKHKAE